MADLRRSASLIAKRASGCHASLHDFLTLHGMFVMPLEGASANAPNFKPSRLLPGNRTYATYARAQENQTPLGLELR